MESGRPKLAPCVQHGSMAQMVWHIILRRILTSLLSLPLMSPLCVHTLARAAGTNYAFLALATVLSNMTWAAKTGKDVRTPRFLFLLAMPTALCAIFTVRILGWARKSKSAA